MSGSVLWRLYYMCQIALTIPNEVLFDTKMNNEEALDFARKAVALRYYTIEGGIIGVLCPDCQYEKR